MDPLLFVFLIPFGLILGSFQNVLIYRLPRHQSIVKPRSFCPACQKPIRAHQNIPILSFIALGGKCNQCRASIPLQYPLVELASAAVLLLFSILLGFEPAHFGLLLFSVFLVSVVVIDARHFIIPNQITLPFLGLGLAVSFAPGGIGPLQSGLGIAAGGGVLYLAYAIGWVLFKKEGIGGGDIKLLAAAGAFLGPWAMVTITFVGSTTALAVVLAGGFFGKGIRGRKIAFGPYLAVGIWVTIWLWAKKLWIFGMLGPL